VARVSRQKAGGLTLPGLALGLEQLAPHRCFACLWNSGSTAGSTASS